MLSNLCCIIITIIYYNHHTILVYACLATSSARDKGGNLMNFVKRHFLSNPKSFRTFPDKKVSQK